MRASMAVFALAAVAALFSAGAQQAFRCTDAAGRVTYQESPCPSAATERKRDFDARRQQLELEWRTLNGGQSDQARLH